MVFSHRATAKAAIPSAPGPPSAPGSESSDYSPKATSPTTAGRIRAGSTPLCLLPLWNGRSPHTAPLVLHHRIGVVFVAVERDILHTRALLSFSFCGRLTPAKGARFHNITSRHTTGARLRDSGRTATTPNPEPSSEAAPRAFLGKEATFPKEAGAI